MPRKNTANLLARESILLAFLDLLRTEEYGRITITDITRRAGVSRNAYYRNYDSKEGILFSKMDEISEEIDRRYAQRQGKTEGQMLDCCFEVCGENGTFLAALCRCGREDLIRSHLSLRIEKALKPRESPGKEFYKACFYLSGLYGVIIAWVESGMKAPAAQMARWTCQLVGLRE